MTTRVKIKINDNSELRFQLDTIYQSKLQVEMARWEIRLAKHILELVNYDYENCDVIQEGFKKEGFKTNEQWQKGEARMHDVRQAGFKIHRLAKACPDLMTQAALRVVGQAVSTGHMKEHVMVVSDYAVKVMNLMFPNDIDAVTKEREWQISYFE